MFRRAFYLLCASHKVVSGRPARMRIERRTFDVRVLRAADHCRPIFSFNEGLLTPRVTRAGKGLQPRSQLLSHLFPILRTLGFAGQFAFGQFGHYHDLHAMLEKHLCKRSRTADP